MNTCLKRLTIVIPAKNESRLLPSLLESLCKQDYELMSSVKVFVADAGSTDGTPQMMADRYGSNPRVRYVRQEHNRGAASARNLGLAHARGNYIAFLDSDDAYRPGRSGGDADL